MTVGPTTNVSGGCCGFESNKTETVVIGARRNPSDIFLETGIYLSLLLTNVIVAEITKSYKLIQTVGDCTSDQSYPLKL